MRLTLDTNVLLSAFAASGRCERLFVHCLERAHVLVTSQELIEEFRRKLLGKWKLSPPAVDTAVGAYFSDVEIVKPAPLGEPVCRDPDDDVVLATALAGRCRCNVTGDRDPLVLGDYQGIVIVSPRDFWNFESSQISSPDPNA